MFEEERIKYFLKIGLISIIVLVLIFFLVKTFILKPPKPPQPPPTPEIPLSPEEIVIKYFELEESRNRTEAEKYLFSDFSKVEIFEEKYQNLRSFLWIPQKEDSLPEYQIIGKEIKESEAKIAIEIKTNRMENSLFFKFRLPEKIVFETDLVKENNRWKIIKIHSPSLILEKKLGEKVEVEENVFLKPIEIKDYQPKDIRPKQKPTKFFSLEIEYENKSTRPVDFSLFSEWKIVGEEKESFYYAIPEPTLDSAEVTLSPLRLAPNEIKKRDIYFEVSKDFIAKGIIFQNQYKKVIFKID